MDVYITDQAQFDSAARNAEDANLSDEASSKTQPLSLWQWWNATIDNLDEDLSNCSSNQIQLDQPLMH